MRIGIRLGRWVTSFIICSYRISSTVILITFRGGFCYRIYRVTLYVNHPDSVAYINGLRKSFPCCINVIGTTTCRICRRILGIIIRIVFTIIDTIVDRVFRAAIICSLCRKCIAIRICHGHLNGKRIKIIYFFIILIHNLFADVDTTLQGVGCREAVSKFFDSFNTGDGLAISSISEDNVHDMIFLAHDHRVMMICCQFEMLVRFALFEDVVMTFFNKCICYAVPFNVHYVLNAITRVGRAILIYHDTWCNADVI